jgi:hypothetical protein
VGKHCSRLGEKETYMNRPILVCALLFLTTAALGAQDASQSSPYQGTSNPPPDDAIITSATPQAKPPAGHPASPAIMPAAEQAPPSGAAVENDVDPNAGTVASQQSAPAPRQPALTQRSFDSDPDGGIVHPRPLRPGELPEGTNIRVRLMDGLSTSSSEKGEAFRGRVASDVLLGEKVVIPAGSEIDGRVVQVSSGHAGGHGSMHLRPEAVTLPDGRRYQLQAEITGTPGSRTRVGNEGTILPDSRLKRDGIEYGGAVGAGATTGAILGGPVGALAGTMVGAGVISIHLLVSHPQATLDPGTALLLTLTEPLQMAPVSAVAVRENQ